MASNQEDSKTQVRSIIASLEKMRRFTGPPNEFWPLFLEAAARLISAKVGLLMVREAEAVVWKTLLVWPEGGMGALKGSDIAGPLEEIASQATDQGYARQRLGNADSLGRDMTALSVRLNLEDERRETSLILITEGPSGLDVEEASVRLNLAADIPAVYQMGRAARQARDDVVQFAEALDLMVLLNAEKRYMAAAMTFCNELASRRQCDRVSLGWLKGAYVRLQAVSHMERFDKKMDAVQTLEAAMEEAFDQDEEILWPRPEGSFSVVRDHEAFSREQGAKNIVSLPIRLDDHPIGVVTCERSSTPFLEEDVRGLRVQCDQAARRLGDLKRSDRWFGARASASVKESLAKLLGVEHTFAKLMGLLVCGVLAFLILGKMEYRVEAPFILKTEDLAYLPAPFDGYIDEVHVKIGDRVKTSVPLVSLDTRELLLEESAAIANESRYSREAEKAQAQNALADMKIAQTLEAQARARLELVRYHIDHATVKAAFDGIVVEGDLEEMLGAPVRKGDVLLKVARLDKMYVELKVDERDINEVAKGERGEIAFLSRPNLKFPVKVEQIEPVAIAEEEGNVFMVRAFLTGNEVGWLRPGMSGVAKIHAGKRNVLWIFTHRTIDFIRIFLWW
jgi:hypothetical protein